MEFFRKAEQKPKVHFKFADIDIGDIFFIGDTAYMKIPNVKYEKEWCNAVILSGVNQGVLDLIDEVHEVILLRVEPRIEYDPNDLVEWIE